MGCGQRSRSGDDGPLSPKALRTNHGWQAHDPVFPKWSVRRQNSSAK